MCRDDPSNCLFAIGAIDAYLYPAEEFGQCGFHSDETEYLKPFQWQTVVGSIYREQPKLYLVAQAYAA